MNWQSSVSEHWGRVQHLTSRQRVVACAAGTALVATTVGIAKQHIVSLPNFDLTHSNCKLPRPLMEAAFGALGEIVQVAVLYPLDTIKVRCQATGTSATSIIQDMLRRGITPAVIRDLYTGVIVSSVFSVVIGSVYYMSFCVAKRWAGGVYDSLTIPRTASPISAAGTAAAHPHAHHHDHDMPAIHDPIAAAQPTSSEDKLPVNIFAAVFAALVGALIEAPIELFRNRAKAGMLNHSMMGAMAEALRTGGPRMLYWGFLPYCLKSLPFDIGELITWSQLRDWQGRIQDMHGQPGKTEERFETQDLTSSGLFCETNEDGMKAWSRQRAERWLAHNVPEQLWDAALGACAGAAAVLISMPCDVIKTTVDTRSGVIGTGPGFWKTGLSLVAKSGPGALFTGVVPRLAEKVPSTMLYWVTVEYCRRMCTPLMQEEGEEGGKSK